MELALSPLQLDTSCIILGSQEKCSQSHGNAHSMTDTAENYKKIITHESWRKYRICTTIVEYIKQLTCEKLFSGCDQQSSTTVFPSTEYNSIICLIDNLVKYNKIQFLQEKWHGSLFKGKWGLAVC